MAGARSPGGFHRGGKGVLVRGAAGVAIGVSGRQRSSSRGWAASEDTQSQTALHAKDETAIALAETMRWFTGSFTTEADFHGHLQP